MTSSSDMEGRSSPGMKLPGEAVNVSNSARDSGSNSKRVAVLASGRGTDFQAIVDAVEAGLVSFNLSLLICNREDAFVIERARKHSIPFVVISHKNRDRIDFDMEMDRVLREAGTDLIVLAGFMRILSDRFVKKWRDRIVNIHPALLPSFPGAHAHEDALDYGVKVTGLTIHFVDETMDGGPVIFQHAVKVLDDDTPESLSGRVLAKEHQFYPVVIEDVVNGKYLRKGRKVIRLKD